MPALEPGHGMPALTVAAATHAAAIMVLVRMMGGKQVACFDGSVVLGEGGEQDTLGLALLRLRVVSDRGVSHSRGLPGKTEKSKQVGNRLALSNG